MAEKDSREPRRGRVERRINSARDSLPGERNDLPDGALGGVPADPQGDENRDPCRTRRSFRPRCQEPSHVQYR
jgi:hypothetical protein